MNVVALAPFTSFNVGGPADWLLDVSTTDELTSAVRLATQEPMPVTVLGGGSNVLIGDFGIRGLVVVVRTSRIAMSGASEVRADAGVTMNGLVRWTITRGLGGLAADGQSRVRPLETVERGYSRLVDNLRALGARVDRVSD